MKAMAAAMAKIEAKNINITAKIEEIENGGVCGVIGERSAASAAAIMK